MAEAGWASQAELASEAEGLGSLARRFWAKEMVSLTSPECLNGIPHFAQAFGALRRPPMSWEQISSVEELRFHMTDLE